MTNAKYETVEDLEKAIESYFGKAEADKDFKPTITGLALELGFESRQSIYDYEKEGAFSYTIKRARLHIESIYEMNLHSGNATGSIFALKNFGWKDKQETELTGAGGGPIMAKIERVIVDNPTDKDS